MFGQLSVLFKKQYRCNNFTPGEAADSKKLTLNFGKLTKPLGVALLLIGMASTAEAAKIRSLDYGQWKGGVYINDKTGKFSHCVVSAKYKSGIKLLFSVTRGQQWSMGFAKDSWKLELGETYPVFYQVDKRDVLKGKAKAKGKSLAVVTLPAKTKIFNQMRRGRTLRVKAGNDILAFRLTGTNRMLSSLLRCSQKYNNFVSDSVAQKEDGLNKSANPFAKNSTKSSDNPFAALRAVTREEKREGKAWFDQYLLKSSVKHRSVRENEKSAKLYKTYAQLWLSGPRSKIVGSLRILDKEQSKFFAKKFPAKRKSLCKGDYSFRTIPNEIETSTPMLRFVATCKLENKPLKTFYHILSQRTFESSYFISLISDKVPSEDVVLAGSDISSKIQSGAPANSKKNVKVRDF